MPLDLINPVITLKGGYKVVQDPQDLQLILGQEAIGTVEQLLSQKWILWAPDQQSFWQFIRILESQLQDGHHYEYQHVQGQLIMSPARSSHSLMILFIMTLISELSPQFIGRMEFGIQLNHWPITLTPDVVVLSPQQNQQYHFTQDPFPEMPLVVIEILSSSTRRDNLCWQVGSKPSKLDYFVAGGLEEYWIIDPEQAMIRIFSRLELLEAQSTQKELQFHKTSLPIESHLLTGFRISAEEFWDLFEIFCRNPQIRR